MLQAIVVGTLEPVGEEIPWSLRTIVEKTLEKDVAKRYQSMRDVVVDLKRVQRQISAAQRPDRAPGDNSRATAADLENRGYRRCPFVRDRVRYHVVTGASRLFLAKPTRGRENRTAYRFRKVTKWTRRSRLGMETHGFPVRSRRIV